MKETKAFSDFHMIASNTDKKNKFQAYCLHLKASSAQEVSGGLKTQELVQVLPGLKLPTPSPLPRPPGPGSCPIQGGGSAGDSE